MSEENMGYQRKLEEYPRAISDWGWRFHHVGIPTLDSKPGEEYIEEFKMYVSGYEKSPYGIEWMRFEEDSPIPELIQQVSHLAFVVENLEAALVGKEMLTAPNSPSEGLMVAMILDDGAPIELMQFSSKK
jgi:hypothetical protein